MTYRVHLTAPAQRHLHKLPEKIATAAVEFIYSNLAANPRKLGKPLSGPLEGNHVARRGTYRIIYRIDETNQRILIGAVVQSADVDHSSSTLAEVSGLMQSTVARVSTRSAE